MCQFLFLENLESSTFLLGGTTGFEQNLPTSPEFGFVSHPGSCQDTQHTLFLSLA